MHRTPAGFPSGMPGMGLVIEGAVQHAPQAGRQSMRHCNRRASAIGRLFLTRRRGIWYLYMYHHRFPGSPGVICSTTTTIKRHDGAFDSDIPVVPESAAGRGPRAMLQTRRGNHDPAHDRMARFTRQETSHG